MLPCPNLYPYHEIFSWKGVTESDMEQRMMMGPFTMLPKDKIDSFRPQVEKFVVLHYLYLHFSLN